MKCCGRCVPNPRVRGYDPRDRNSHGYDCTLRAAQCRHVRQVADRARSQRSRRVEMPDGCTAGHKQNSNERGPQGR